MSASTQIITDLQAARDRALSATATAAAIAAGGPIMDLPGMLDLAVIKAQELKVCLQAIDANVAIGTDATTQGNITDVLDSLD